MKGRGPIRWVAGHLASGALWATGAAIVRRILKV